MNVNDYIASGIVELYAMNALPPDEKKEFERLMLLYPEIVKELRRVENALEEYAESHAMNPRPNLRQTIIEKVIVDDKKIIGKTKAITDDHTLTYKYMIAASLAALVVSTFASWFFYTRWNEAERKFSDLLNEKNELAQNYNLVKSTYDETLTMVMIMRDAAANIIVLNAKDKTQNFQARVYWNKQTHRSYIDVISLPEPGEGKQFQLWALVGGQPVDAGVINISEERIQRVKDIIQADLWAVTLEPKGGSASPSLDQMYLISRSS